MADIPYQFQMAYVAEQDRILLRISTRDKAEFRLWLTRRAVKMLWDASLMTVRVGSAEDSANEAGKCEALLLFEHQSAVEQADFETPFQETVGNFPLGEEGILVTSMRVGKKSAGVYTLKLGSTQGNGITFSLNDKLMHSFMQMLIDSSNGTDWALQLNLPVPESTSHADPSHSGRVIRH